MCVRRAWIESGFSVVLLWVWVLRHSDGTWTEYRYCDVFGNEMAFSFSEKKLFFLAI